IVFSLLDSHTTSSHFSNIRIDNYVYTLEALQAAKKLLKADGIFIIKFQVDTPWIAGRLYGLLQSVFGHAPLQLEADSSYIAYTTGGRFFISGSEHRIQEALSDRRLAAYVAKHNDFQMSPASLTTDDWPYFYQHEPGLPASVIIISVALVILCWMLLRDTGAGLRSTRWHFFFLGAGFLLLEAQIVSKMALFIWNHVDREFDRYFGPAFTDCRRQFSGTARASLPSRHCLCGDLLNLVCQLCSSSRKTVLRCNVGESANGHDSPLPSGTLRWHHIRSQFCSRGLSRGSSRFQPNGLHGWGNSRIGIAMDRDPVSARSCGLALPGFVDRACG